MNGQQHLLLVLLVACAGHTCADVYMQYPPGSNNRLDEGGGNRNNNNRLMDTQNNAKGGYGYGGSATQKAAPLKYMVNSKLSMSWTSQHSCGSENAECQMVIQYMCNDGTSAPPGVRNVGSSAGEGPIRDGTDNNTPNPDDEDGARGLHEPTSFYKDCDARERNKGLYTADQNLNGNDARRTRQNPNGQRSGLECPEERDYYPYWGPSPWKDLMIMTNNLKQCPFYQSASQNVAPRGYCTGADAGDVPNHPGNDPGTGGVGGCEARNGQWVEVPAHGIPPPQCVAAPFQRDNHLGSDMTGYEVMANLTIPKGAGTLGADDATNCVLRLRYNITTADTRVCSDRTLTTRAECEAAGEDWSAFYLDASYNDRTLEDTPPLPEQNPTVSMDGFLKDRSTLNDETDSLLELAINTNQYGRTFQDRTHVFSIQSRPERIADNIPILNLNVKGKRGNIVQTYPAVEYDFHPTVLVAGQDEMVHIQWTGNDNTNNNGNNNGEGRNNEDRHNIVQLDNSGMDVPMPGSQASMFDVAWEWNPEPPNPDLSNPAAPVNPFAGARDREELTKQFALVKQTGCLPQGDINGDQQRQNCQKLNAASATVDLGLIKFKPGTYKYMSSRNNNFSNRAQKAQLNILNSSAVTPAPPVNVQAVPLASSRSGLAKMQVTWAPPGSDEGSIGTDGKVYWGRAQAASTAFAYTVQYSCDGGLNWLPTNCATLSTTCEVDGLPAGQPCAFRVLSASQGGWGTASEVSLALTPGEAGASELDGGIIFLIVALSLAGAGGIAYVLAKMFFAPVSVPPPPPPGMYKEAPTSCSSPPVP